MAEGIHSSLPSFLTTLSWNIKAGDSRVSKVVINDKNIQYISLSGKVEVEYRTEKESIIL